MNFARYAVVPPVREDRTPPLILLGAFIKIKKGPIRILALPICDKRERLN